MNLFRSELIQSYSKSGTGAGTGNWTIRNGVPAIDLRPAPFYQNLDNGSASGTLRGLFTPNTSYIVDMWIDVDDMVYNNNNVAGGMQVCYSDGTNESFVFTGNQSTPKGFQHKKVITPATKSITLLSIYYYTSAPVYYRWDSYIAPVTDLNIAKTGQLNNAILIENQNQASFSKGGAVYGNEFYEY